MNVTCPTCQTVFRVDPAKVPERGVRARCSVCAGIFFVERPGGPVPPEAAGSQPATRRPAAEPVTTGVAAPATYAGPGPAPIGSSAAAPATTAPGQGVQPPAAPVGGIPAPPAVPRSPVPERAASPTPGPGARPAPPVARRPINPFLSQDPDTRARRLARALISDLVVYNPAKRADGLRDGSLRILFEEEIKKCWEEYTDQVGMELAASTPYFTEALNEILADGRPMFS